MPVFNQQRLSFGLLFGLLGGACSLQSIDELQTGTPTTRTADDASATASDAAVGPAGEVDATVSGSVGDRDAALPVRDVDVAAPGQSDAGQGGSTTPDAGPSGSAFVCPTPATSMLVVCDDFEQGVLPGAQTERAGWDWYEQIGDAGADGGSLLADANKPSGRSFRSAAGRVGMPQSARLMKTVPMPSTSVSAVFDFTPQLSKDLGTDIVQLVRLQQQLGIDYPGVMLAATHDVIILKVDNIIAGEWVHEIDEAIHGFIDRTVRIQLDLTLGEKGSVRVSFDGVTVFARDKVRVGTPNAEMTYFALGLYTDSTPPTSALYDNVLVQIVR